MLLISEEEKEAVNAKDRSINLNDIYFLCVLLCLESTSVNTKQQKKFMFIIWYRCPSRIIILIGVEVKAHPRVRQRSVCVYL